MLVESKINPLKIIAGGDLSRSDVPERIEASLRMDNGDPTSLGILTGKILRELIYNRRLQRW